MHRFQLPRLGSELASDGGKSDRFFSSSSFCYLGFVLAPRFFGQQLAEGFCAEFAGCTTSNTGSSDYWRGYFPVLLKMFVLSASSVVLWLAPLVGLDKRVSWHKSLQGLSLVAAVSCAIGAGNIARRLAEEAEIEELKIRAIKADVVDEISTSIYVSQAQRQQEAEAILASPGVDVESAREALEVLYSKDFEEEAEVTTPTATEPSELDKSLYAEVCKSREAGKTNTWIIENILKMKGRKFGEGKVKLQELLNQFEFE